MIDFPFQNEATQPKTKGWEKKKKGGKGAKKKKKPLSKPAAKKILPDKADAKDAPPNGVGTGPLSL